MSVLALKKRTGKSGKAAKSKVRKKKAPSQKAASGKIKSGSEAKKAPKPVQKQDAMMVKPVKANTDQKSATVKVPAMKPSQKSEAAQPSKVAEQPVRSAQKKTEKPAASQPLSSPETMPVSATSKPMEEPGSAENTESGVMPETLLPTLDNKSEAQIEAPATATQETATSISGDPGTEETGTETISENKISEAPVQSTAPGAGDGQAVAPLTMSGSSDEALQQFTNAGASQIAASFPTLGTAVTDKLNEEQKTTAETTVAASARMNGPANPKMKKAPAVVSTASPSLGSGITESEPPPLKPSFTKTGTGETINTSAGKRPAISTRGKANPARAARQKNKSKAIIKAQKAKTIARIQAHPGKQNIQPVFLNKTAPVNIPKAAKASVETSPQQSMERFAKMPLPAAVRQRADERMAPLMAPNMAKSRQEINRAATERDSEKEKAIAKNKEAVDKLNANAEKEQQDVVTKARGTVAKEQQSGLLEAQQKTEAFNTLMNKEEAAVNKGVQSKIRASEKGAAKVLKDAESKANAEKKRGAEKAKQEEKNAKKSSWWSKATAFAKKALSAVGKVIGKIFDGIRKAVKSIIDKAKKAALSLIEKGRKWIVNKLESFGKWAKGAVNKYLSVFPALQQKLNSFIDTTVNLAKSAVNKIANRLKAGVKALADGLASAIDSVLSKFQKAVKAAVAVMGALLSGDFTEALKIAFFAVCDIAGIDPNPILNFINKAGNTISIIFNDPGAFFNNVAGGVKKGLGQFRKNIKKHLLNGLIGWLTGAIAQAGITLPEKFDLKGVFSMVMQTLGLTYTNVRAKVVKAIGPKGETVVSGIEKTVDFVKDFMNRGPVALWDRVKESLSNLKETVMSGIRNWVVTKVIEGGITWLLSLLNPASAIVRAVKMLYDVVMFFVNRWQQISGFAQSVFNSVGELARGNLSKAANAVENALGRSVPVIIGFMASLIGLGGVGKAIKNIIDKVRKPIDKALDKVINWIVKKGKALFGKGKAAVKKGVEKVKNFLFPEKRFKAGNEEHRIYVGGGENPRLMIASTPQPVGTFLEPYNKGSKKNAVKEAREYATGTIQPLIKRLKDAKTQKTKNKLNGELLSAEVTLSEMLRKIIGTGSLKNADEKYKLEGLTGTYASMPKPKGDALTADHQPQAALFKYAAELPFFENTKMEERGKKGSHVPQGYAINLHEIRHKAGRTYGSKGSTTKKAFIAMVEGKISENSSLTPVQKQKKVINLMKADLKQDVSEMKKVAGKTVSDPVYSDLQKVFPNDMEKRKELRDKIRTQILAGEAKIANQDLDSLAKPK